MLAHTIESRLIDKSVVRDEANDAIATIEPVRGPSEKLYVGVIEFALAAGD
jgi:hypothetical protein